MSDAVELYSGIARALVEDHGHDPEVLKREIARKLTHAGKPNEARPEDACKRCGWNAKYELPSYAVDPIEPATLLKAGRPIMGYRLYGLVLVDPNGLTPLEVEDWIHTAVLSRLMKGGRVVLVQEDRKGTP